MVIGVKCGGIINLGNIEQSICLELAFNAACGMIATGSLDDAEEQLTLLRAELNVAAAAGDEPRQTAEALL